VTLQDGPTRHDLNQAPMIPYWEIIDDECVPLCKALNALPGVETRKSCSGHGRSIYSILFLAVSPDRIRPLLNVLWRLQEETRYSWTVEILAAHGCCRVRGEHAGFRYILKGPTGEAAYRDAEKLAAALTRQRRR